MSKFEKYGTMISKWVLILFGLYLLFHFIGGWTIAVVLLILFKTLKG